MNQFSKTSAITAIDLFLESCGFYLLFTVISALLRVPGAAIPFWLVILALAWSFLFSFYIQTVKFSLNIRGAIGMVLSIASLLFLVGINTNLGLSAIGNVVTGDWNTAVMIALNFAFLVLLWWRGGSIAQDDITLDTLRGSFLWGLVVMFFAVMIDSLSSLKVINGFLIVGFFGVGLGGLSLARFAAEGGESTGISKDWVVPIIASVGAVLLLGLLLSGLGLGGLDDVTRAILAFVGNVGLGLLRPFLLVLGHLAALLVQLGNWLSGVLGGGDLSGLEMAQTQIQQFHESLQEVEDGGPPRFLVASLKWAAFLVAASLVVWLLYRLFRFRRYVGGPAEVEETRESLFSWAKANNDLSALLAGWWGNLMHAAGRGRRGQPDPQTPREVYHSFLEMSEEMGLPRSEWQSPKEHQESVKGFLPPSPVNRIVDEFQLSHYGQGRIDGDRWQLLLSDWSAVRQVVEHYSQAKVDPVG